MELLAYVLPVSSRVRERMLGKELSTGTRDLTHSEPCATSGSPDMMLASCDSQTPEPGKRRLCDLAFLWVRLPPRHTTPNLIVTGRDYFPHLLGNKTKEYREVEA